MRFQNLNIAELQQLLLAVIHTERDHHILRPGPGNLLPGLRDEIAAVLRANLKEEDRKEADVHP